MEIEFSHKWKLSRSMQNKKILKKSQVLSGYIKPKFTFTFSCKHTGGKFIANWIVSNEETFLYQADPSKFNMGYDENIGWYK